MRWTQFLVTLTTGFSRSKITRASKLQDKEEIVLKLMTLANDIKRKDKFDKPPT